MMHDLGHSLRYWESVNVGDELTERVFGPHSIVSFTTEWRSYTFTQWGSMHRRTDLDMAELGFTGPMAGPEQDPTEEAILGLLERAAAMRTECRVVTEQIGATQADLHGVEGTRLSDRHGAADVPRIS